MRSSWTGIGAAALAGMVFAGSARAEEARLAASALPVRIALSDSGFWFHNIGIRAAAIDLTIVNEGKQTHALAIVASGSGAPLEIETPALTGGTKAELLLRLPVGQYEIFSPLDHDRDHGLAAPMKIISPSPADRAGAEMNRIFYNY